MYNPRNKKLTINISDELKRKIKGYAAFSNISLEIFINRILIEKVKGIEKGEDLFIKIEKIK